MYEALGSPDSLISNERTWSKQAAGSRQYQSVNRTESVYSERSTKTIAKDNLQALQLLSCVRSISIRLLCRLTKLELLPLMVQFELNDTMLYISSNNILLVSTSVNISWTRCWDIITLKQAQNRLDTLQTSELILNQ